MNKVGEVHQVFLDTQAVLVMARNFPSRRCRWHSGNKDDHKDDTDNNDDEDAVMIMRRRML